MFCGPPVEAAVACGNARCGRERSRRVLYAGSANDMAVASCAQSPRGRNHRKVSLNRAEPRCSRVLPPARVTIF